MAFPEALTKKDVYDLSLESLLTVPAERVGGLFTKDSVIGDDRAQGEFNHEVISAFMESDRFGRYSICLLRSNEIDLETLVLKIKEVKDNENLFDKPDRNHTSHYILDRKSDRPSIIFSKVERRQVKVPLDDGSDGYMIEDEDILFRAQVRIDVTPKGKPFLVMKLPIFVKKVHAPPYAYQDEIQFIGNWCAYELGFAVSALDLKQFFDYLPMKANGVRKRLFKAEGMSTARSSVLSSMLQISNEGSDLQELCEEWDPTLRDLVEDWLEAGLQLLPSSSDLPINFAQDLVSQMDISTGEFMEAIVARHKHGSGKVSIDIRDKTVHYTLIYDKTTTGIIRTVVGSINFEPLLGKIRSFIDGKAE